MLNSIEESFESVMNEKNKTLPELRLLQYVLVGLHSECANDKIYYIFWLQCIEYNN